MSGTRAAPRADLVGAGLVALAATCFGTLGPVSRAAGEAGIDALTLVTWRAGLGALCVAAFIAGRAVAAGAWPASLRAVPRRDRWFMLAAAAANTAVNLAAFIAFERITIALALLVFYVYPAGVALASTIWFGERLGALRWSAFGVSLAGMGLVVAGSGSVGTVDPLGVGLAFLAAMAQVFYVLAARHGFAHVPAPEAAALTMAGAAILYVVAALVIGVGGRLAGPLATPEALVPVALAGIIGAGLPTLAFVTGIRRLGPSRAAILSTLEPVVGGVLAAWLLAERPTSVQLVGGALILGAAVLLQLPAGVRADHEAVVRPDRDPGEP